MEGEFAGWSSGPVPGRYLASVVGLVGGAPPTLERARVGVRARPWRRWVTLGTAVVVVAILAWALTAYDLGTRSELRSGDARLALLRHETAVVQGRLAAVRLQLTVAHGRQTAAHQALGTAEAELSATDTRLSTASWVAGLETGEVESLGTCLAGVEESLNQLSIGDTTGALQSLATVHTACTTAEQSGG